GRNLLMRGYIVVIIGVECWTDERLWVTIFVADSGGEVFQVGTLVVNITGSFAIGFFAAFTDPEGSFFMSPRLRQFFMIGVCGGYTTFLFFSLQTLDLVRDGDWFKGGVDTLLSFVCCLAAVLLGSIFVLAILTK